MSTAELASIDPKSTSRTSVAQDQAQERSVTRLATVAVISLGLLSAWLCRYSMDPDGISYLDIGDAFVHRNWSLAFNTYWSPAYAWLLGLGVHFFGRTPTSELLAAHGVNFCIYLFCYGTFTFFLQTCIRFLRQKNADQSLCPLPVWGILSVGFSLFLWSSLTMVTVWGVSPDLLVAGMVFLIAGLIEQIRRGASIAASFKLGIALGIAYWCKAVMFPLGIAFALVAIRLARNRRTYHFLAISIPFALISFPLILGISRVNHRWTFGDTGWLNYSSLVSPGGRVRNWQGEPLASGTPLHPTRQVLKDPPLFEFAEPFEVTYSPTFEPGYWNAGRTWKFSLKAQIGVVRRHSLTYLELLLHSQAGLLVFVLALFACGWHFRTLVEYWPLLSIPVLSFALYALVHSEWRFLGAQVAIGWLVLLFAVRLPENLAQSRLVSSLLLAVAASILFSVFGGIARDLRSRDLYSGLPHVAIADDLQKMGFGEHTRFAVIGDGDWAYWARLGHMRFVTEIMAGDAPAFWALPAEQRASVYNAMAKTGASAVAAEPPLPLAALDQGWTRVGMSTWYVRRLN